jgi:hypothetical protein
VPWGDRFRVAYWLGDGQRAGRPWSWIDPDLSTRTEPRRAGTGADASEAASTLTCAAGAVTGAAVTEAHAGAGSSTDARAISRADAGARSVHTVSRGAAAERFYEGLHQARR